MSVSPQADPLSFLAKLYQAAVQRALPLHNTAAWLPPPPPGRTLVLGAGKAGGAMAHAFERYVVETGTLGKGFHVFFAESLDTFAADLHGLRLGLLTRLRLLLLEPGLFGQPLDRAHRVRLRIRHGIVLARVRLGLGPA